MGSRAILAQELSTSFSRVRRTELCCNGATEPSFPRGCHDPVRLCLSPPSRARHRQRRRHQHRLIRRSLEHKNNLAAEIDRMREFTQQMVDQVFQFWRARFSGDRDIEVLDGHPQEERLPYQRIGGRAYRRHGRQRGDRASRSSRSARTSTAFRRPSQKPGVAYHDPIIEGAPGHGEGHNSGMPLNITAALALKKIMERESASRHDSAVARHRRRAARDQGLLRSSRRVQGRRCRPCSRTSEPISG